MALPLVNRRIQGVGVRLQPGMTLADRVCTRRSWLPPVEPEKDVVDAEPRDRNSDASGTSLGRCHAREPLLEAFESRFVLREVTVDLLPRLSCATEAGLGDIVDEWKQPRPFVVEDLVCGRRSHAVGTVDEPIG